MLGLQTRLDFGKYRGKLVAEILESDPTYLLFLRRPKGAYEGRKNGTPTPMTEELHLTLDALLMENHSLSERGKNKPKYPKEKVELFLAQLENAAGYEAAAAVAIEDQRTVAYSGLWGSF